MGRKQIHLWPEPFAEETGSLVVAVHLEGVPWGLRSYRFRVDESYAPSLTLHADPWATAMVFLAMRAARDLHIHGSVSHSLLANLERFQWIWSRWRPDRYTVVEIEADEERGDAPRQGAGILGFTGGVDSCFTAYRHHCNLLGRRHLPLAAGLTVMGFDIPVSERDQFGLVLSRCGRLLSSIGLESLWVETDLRDQPIEWNDLHGSVLAACLTLLSGRFAFGVIASSIPIARLGWPLGSHLLTDHLLGGKHFPVVHDGAEMNREDKVRLLAEWPQAERDLRVCWENDDRAENCGRCYKCLRTKLCYLVNGLSVPSALGGMPTPEDVGGWRLNHEWQIADVQNLVHRARSEGQEKEPWFPPLEGLIANDKKFRRRVLASRLRKLARHVDPHVILAVLRGYGR